MSDAPPNCRSLRSYLTALVVMPAILWFVFAKWLVSIELATLFIGAYLGWLFTSWHYKDLLLGARETIAHLHQLGEEIAKRRH